MFHEHAQRVRPFFSVQEYEILEDAFLKTQFGRWFLGEYARRHLSREEEDHGEAKAVFHPLEDLKARLEESGLSAGDFLAQPPGKSDVITKRGESFFKEASALFEEERRDVPTPSLPSQRARIEGEKRSHRITVRYHTSSKSLEIPGLYGEE